MIISARARPCRRHQDTMPKWRRERVEGRSKSLGYCDEYLRIQSQISEALSRSFMINFWISHTIDAQNDLSHLFAANENAKTSEIELDENYTCLNLVNHSSHPRVNSLLDLET